VRGISRTVLAQDLAATITDGNCKGHEVERVIRLAPCNTRA